MLKQDGYERHTARRAAVAKLLASDMEMSSSQMGRSANIDGYDLTSFRSRYWQDDGDVTSRVVRINIQTNGEIIGVANFTEWKLAPFVAAPKFWDYADGDTADDGLAAKIVAEFWDPYDWPPDYGNVLVFHRLAIDSSADPRHSALRRLGQFIPIEFGRRVSIMLLKAYPLEFEAVLLPDGGWQTAIDPSGTFERRLRAMFRLYASALAVKPLHAQNLYPGWMWRSIRYCPEPKRRKKFRYPELKWQ